MNEWLAHSILMESLQALGVSPVAWEQREFSPPSDGSLWYAVANMPAERVPVTLGDAGEDRYAGILQIDVNGEQGKGVRPVLEAAAAVTAYYRAGRSFVRGTDAVRIMRSELSAPRREGVRLVASISVYWETRIQR